MKLCLILPNLRWNNANDSYLQQRFIPYGLCLLASIIRADKRFCVEILDAYMNDWSEEDLVTAIKRCNPDVVGISVPYDRCAFSGHRTAALTKQLFPNVITIMGGPYVTAHPDRAIEDPWVNHIIMGEGENVILPLLRKLLTSEDEVLPQGVYDKVSYSPEAAVPAIFNERLDDLPLPAYDLIDFHRYSAKFERTGLEKIPTPFMNMISSRGCPYNCIFCNAGLYAGKKFRARSADSVLEEIGWLAKEYGVRFLDIQDENFFYDRERAKKIMKGLVGSNIEWMCSNVAVFSMDDEILELAAISGCIQMNFAIESGTERVLHEIIRKPTRNLEQVRSVVRKANEVGIFSVGYFVIGFPGETWDEIRSTLCFAETLELGLVKVFNATPLERTDLHKLSIETGSLKNGMIETEHFTIRDLRILRAYEWERINFADAVRRKRIMEFYDLTEQQLNEIRHATLRGLIL